jgi:hypothetical protein
MNKPYNPSEPNSFDEIYSREMRLKRKRKLKLIEEAMESALKRRVEYQDSSDSSQSVKDVKRKGDNLAGNTDKFGRATAVLYPTVQISGLKVNDQSEADIKQQVMKYAKLMGLKRGQSDISVQVGDLKEAEKVVVKLNGRKYYGKQISAQIL